MIARAAPERHKNVGNLGIWLHRPRHREQSHAEAVALPPFAETISPAKCAPLSNDSTTSRQIARQRVCRAISSGGAPAGAELWLPTPLPVFPNASVSLSAGHMIILSSQSGLHPSQY